MFNLISFTRPSAAASSSLRDGRDSRIPIPPNANDGPWLMPQVSPFAGGQKLSEGSEGVVAGLAGHKQRKGQRRKRKPKNTHTHNKKKRQKERNGMEATEAAESVQERAFWRETS